MPTIMRLALPLLGAGVIALAMCACSTPAYYKVSDPVTGKVYYTEDMYQEHGATHLKDGKTGDAITLQNSEIRRITREEFETSRLQP